MTEESKDSSYNYLCHIKTVYVIHICNKCIISELALLKKITFWYFRGMKTTTVPEIFFHTFIDNDANLTEKKNQPMFDKKTISD